MRKLILLVFLAGAIRTLALDNHFIYIQSESGKPFYLSLNSKVFSSSSTGWLILPLPEGDYQFNIGFPRGEFPDYKFKCKVDKRDMGFVLKNLGDKGWGLQNIQNAELMKGDVVERAAALRGNGGALSSDPFSTMLAVVVDDPSIRQHPYVPEIEKPAPVTSVAKTDSVKAEAVQSTAAPVVGSSAATAVTNNPPPVAAKTATKKGGKVAILGTKKTTAKKQAKPATDSLTAKDSLSSKELDGVAKSMDAKVDSINTAAANSKAPVVTTNALKPAPGLAAGIYRSAQSNGTNGIDLVYVDRDESGNADTVRIFIPKKDEEVAKPEVVAAPPVEQKKPDAKNDPRFLDMAVYPKTAPAESSTNAKPAANTAVSTVQKSDSVKRELPEAATINPNCKGIANDDDLFKLRKKMLTKTDEDAMVMLALKDFKLHCYSADKIRSISYIFLTQKGKYQLLDAAYPYVFDPSNFKKLGDILTDAYYINRFNALIQ